MPIETAYTRNLVLVALRYIEVNFEDAAKSNKTVVTKHGNIVWT